ncbi:MAG: hypothetical protein EXS08_16270 [Planctomycetes bacterium]|nr:hypothetical protein [Planctomycetota bacterium]
MPYGRLWLLALPPDMGKRALVFAGALAFGIWLIYVGRLNVRSRTAQEPGQHGLFLYLLGKSRDVSGRMAVFMGGARIVTGVLLIAFAFVYLTLGEFLKK